MRFFHLSDFHIGKHFHYYNLREDQEYVLNQIVGATKEYKPDAIVIAGDIYDKSVPSADAVSVLNHFLTQLSELEPKIPIMIIAGNHDSAQRLDYAKEILGKQQIYIEGLPPRVSEDYIKRVTLNDEYGEVDFYLLPFVKPGYVRNVFKDEEITTYDDAVNKLISREDIDESKRNVIISHQFYTAGEAEPVRSESETVNVGGLDNVDIKALEKFDYAALGHIHHGQRIGEEKFRYCGTPLKYSVSEEKSEKNISFIELKEKGAPLSIQQIKLETLRDVKKLRGHLEEVLKQELYRKDYVSITITDEVEPYRMREQLEEAFPYLLEIRVDNTRTKSGMSAQEEEIDITSPLETFAGFFKEMQGRELTEQERLIIEKIMEESEE